MRSISLFKNTFDTKPAATTEAYKILHFIKEGKWADKIEALREMSPDEYREAKKDLPAVTFSGDFSSRVADKLKSYSGLIVIDVDHLEKEQIVELKKDFVTDNYIFAAFVSPSNNGLKILVKLNCDPEFHLNGFMSLSNYFENRYGIAADKSGKDICRLCYVSHDPELYYNSDSEEWHVDTSQSVVTVGHNRPPEKFTGKKVSSNVQYIYNVCVKWTERTKVFSEGQRNAYIHCLACTLNRCGVSMEDALFLIDQNFITPNDKWHQSVRSAYMHNKLEHNSIDVYVLEQDVEVEEIPEEKQLSDDEIENDILTATMILLRHKVPVADVKNIMHNYSWKLALEGYMELSAAKLKKLLNTAFKLFQEEKEESGAVLSYAPAENMLARIIDSLNLNSGISTTFEEYDKILGGGLLPGNFYGLIGRGGTFKSILILWMAAENAKAGNITLYLNGEMSEMQFLERLVNKELHLDLAEELRSERINAGNFEEFSAQLMELLGNNLIVVTDTGFTEEGILDTISQIRKKYGKKVGLVVADGVTQMADVKKDEIKSTIYNTGVCKEVAKKANNEQGCAVIGLLHTSGDIPKHFRDTSKNVRGGQKTIANMDGYFCTSLLVDPATMDQQNDDIIYLEGKLYLRYVDKRGSGETISKIIEITKPMNLEVMSLDPNNFEIKI